uniref:RanBD1 domain-containing protein n=1 Tax=Mola mola TaxID=94237 RepID=A0A3Q4ASX2_MOLML
MAKRIADKELTDRNWDQEDEGEEAGTFSVASEDVLKNRAIKKAKRRNIGGEVKLSAPAAFSGFGNGGGFKGLGSLTNGNSVAPTFGGFSSTPASTTTTASGLTFNGPTSTKPTSDIMAKQTNGSAPSPVQSLSSCSSSKEYSRQLTALNCSVRDWITKHVNDNPLCDLNPIFRDYEQHLASIERQYGAISAEGAAPAPAAALFSFSKSTTEEKSSGVTFNFGQKVDSSVLASLGSKTSPSSFSFSNSSASSSQTSLFGGAGSAAPTSLGGTKSEDSQPADENEDDESEEPPKPEVKEVKEKDAFYSKKCKLFYKKESEFKEKGVGTLHLKLTEQGKTQMIVRADTNLGNKKINSLVKCSRWNNVMLVCVPNPPVDDKNPSSPFPLLIRVKTAEDADELYKILEEKKG